MKAIKARSELRMTQTQGGGQRLKVQTCGGAHMGMGTNCLHPESVRIRCATTSQYQCYNTKNVGRLEGRSNAFPVHCLNICFRCSKAMLQ